MPRERAWIGGGIGVGGGGHDPPGVLGGMEAVPAVADSEMVAIVRPSAGESGGMELQVEYPPRAIVQWDVEVYQGDDPASTNQYAAHVVNGTVFESMHAPVRFSEEAGESGRWGGWKWEVVSDRHTVVFHAWRSRVPGCDGCRRRRRGRCGVMNK